jgi:hypothetical protein
MAKNHSRLYALKGRVHGGIARLGQFLPDKRHVFEYSGSTFPETNSNHVFAVYSSKDPVPESSLSVLLAAKALDPRQLEMRFAEGARLYVLSFDTGEFGSLMFVKSGREVRRWMIDLQPDDRVIYGAYTNPNKRGQRLWSHLIRHAMLIEKPANGKWYSDCNIYNAPSRTVLLRNGFKIIATKPVPKG